jgi:integrase
MAGSIGLPLSNWRVNNPLRATIVRMSTCLLIRFMSPEIAEKQILPPAPGTRKLNKEVRAREHLLYEEIELLLKTIDERSKPTDATGKPASRHALRDKAIVLLMFHHGLRVGEASKLQWSQLQLKAPATLHVTRLKKGSPATHPLTKREVRLLNKLRQEYPDNRYVFVSERGDRLVESSIRKLIKKLGQEAGIPFEIHPHMFRHACGFQLAKDGQDTRAIQGYLGHRNIQHTVRYTELAPDRYKDFWKEFDNDGDV